MGSPATPRCWTGSFRRCSPPARPKGATSTWTSTGSCTAATTSPWQPTTAAPQPTHRVGAHPVRRRRPHPHPRLRQRRHPQDHQGRRSHAVRAPLATRHRRHPRAVGVRLRRDHRRRPGRARRRRHLLSHPAQTQPLGHGPPSRLDNDAWTTVSLDRNGPTSAPKSPRTPSPCAAVPPRCTRSRCAASATTSPPSSSSPTAGRPSPAGWSTATPSACPSSNASPKRSAASTLTRCPPRLSRRVAIACYQHPRPSPPAAATLGLLGDGADVTSPAGRAGGHRPARCEPVRGGSDVAGHRRHGGGHSPTSGVARPGRGAAGARSRATTSRTGRWTWAATPYWWRRRRQPRSPPHQAERLVASVTGEAPEGWARVVVADRVVAAAREILRAAVWGWLDRRGHLPIAAPGVLLHTPVQPLIEPARAGDDPLGAQVGTEIAVALGLAAQRRRGVRALAGGAGAVVGAGRPLAHRRAVAASRRRHRPTARHSNACRSGGTTPTAPRVGR